MNGCSWLSKFSIPVSLLTSGCLSMNSGSKYSSKFCSVISGVGHCSCLASSFSSLWFTFNLFAQVSIPRSTRMYFSSLLRFERIMATASDSYTFICLSPPLLSSWSFFTEIAFFNVCVSLICSKPLKMLLKISFLFIFSKNSGNFNSAWLSFSKLRMASTCKKLTFSS